MLTKFYVFSDGGHARVVLDILLQNEIVIEAIVDDKPKKISLFNIPVLATKDFDVVQNANFIVAIGNNVLRKKIVQRHPFSFYSAVHASAAVSKFCNVGLGTVVMAHSVINVGVKIGNHCIINSGSIVEHDCVIEDFVHISPGAALAGNVVVGEGTHIGIGANIIQGIRIGKWATIGAGAVIITDVPDYAVVVGNPGGVIKYSNII